MKLTYTEKICLDFLKNHPMWLTYPALVHLTGLDALAVNSALEALLAYHLIEERFIDQATFRFKGMIFLRMEEYRSITNEALTQE